ncbi:NAD(P)-dependent alcohol dehydrogenase [Litorilinea aerophila]|uniref:NAD(P)-dependent alcohol dehydrogenase n=1 Tax=Litorilinea aerophila TaxID=1204385 RepID=A0A540VDK1_9CHLR|nr:NAD(P)-dependent alcohol dehydrogenase [Litorilinea aerophila]MCC9077354.1 NAD(P)-dependent alcohol dehydrogenase [Litorilinea aerophila]GIV76225.1 MAG: alcohol dehydrogenase [Litorilinea sp.]
MKALVLEEKLKLSLRDIELDEPMGPHDVRIALHTVGICGSDVHYYTHGAIGPFVVREPMILGHEASGTVIEVGSQVKHLQPGDRVCMEPGIPDPNSKATRLGLYNLDPAVRFWATPPVHGVLRPTVVHPAAFTYKLPDNISFAEGAMVEPLAVGLHAANKARIRPGDVAVVMGAGPIGMVTALAALAGGCSRVIMTDVQQPKLDLAATLGPITPVNVARERLTDVVQELTDGWGADLVFECSGNEQAAASVFEPVCPGGAVIYVGIPLQPIAYDVAAAQVKEVRVEHVFRYAHVYPRALALMASGKIDVKPLITDRFTFDQSVEAFEFAAHMPPSSVKAQIVVAE